MWIPPFMNSSWQGFRDVIAIKEAGYIKSCSIYMMKTGNSMEILFLS